MDDVREQRQRVQRAAEARSAARELEELLESVPADDGVKVALPDSACLGAMVVPRIALERLVEVLVALGDGQEPSVLPRAKELSTGEVASLLGVSRQYVVRLIDDGRLPCRRVGNRRRVRVDEALRYVREDDRRRVARLRAVMEADG